jgi:hypothetical protein
MTTTPIEVSETVQRMRKDIRRSAVSMSIDEARFLVDRYYDFQRIRVATSNQRTASEKGAKPCEAIEFIMGQMETVETMIASAMKVFAAARPIGVWLMAQYGIGPVIAAGLIAHIDFHRAVYVGQIYTFAGLTPGMVWAEGQKRPWNAELRRLCWIASGSFVKFHGRDECVYGHYYARAKARLIARNDAGGFAEQAKAELAAKDYSRDTKAKAAYKQGRYPDGRIDAMARRETVKMLLSHLHTVGRFVETGKVPPAPYVFRIDGHNRYWLPPHRELIDGLDDAIRAAYPELELCELK